MRKRDWLIATSLIFLGIMCLTMSVTVASKMTSILPIFHTMINICMVLALPIIVIAIFYIIINQKKGL